MRTIYLECGMGASGNMLAGALLELLPNPEAFLDEMNRAGIPSVTFETRKTVLHGLSGTYFSVKVDGREEGSETEKHTAHASRGITEIGEIVSGLHLPEEVRQSVMAVYGLLAEAEGHVHGKPVSLIHFHEVGALDAIADIAAVCLLFHKLAPEHILASPVCVGGGEVQCAHGTLPVPAPAAASCSAGFLSMKEPLSGSCAHRRARCFSVISFPISAHCPKCGLRRSVTAWETLTAGSQTACAPSSAKRPVIPVL